MDAVDYHDLMSDDNAPLLVPVTAPNSESVLMARCQRIAGKTVGQLAEALNISVPVDLSRHKGWLGQFLEQLLGADAGNQALQDFTALGIELKTLPLNVQGEPKESTYVCTVSFNHHAEMHWRDSWVKRKLSKVLWIPVEADPSISLKDRLIGHAILWQPNTVQLEQLQKDWEELMEQVALGEQADISAKSGQYLQIRPKAANSRVMAKSITADGMPMESNPKGFYLRTTFTRQILTLDNACC